MAPELRHSPRNHRTTHSSPKRSSRESESDYFRSNPQSHLHKKNPIEAMGGSGSLRSIHSK
jgi:hypothetical protein